MEEDKKKTVMIVVIVVCLVAAGVIFKATRPKSQGPEALRGQQIWVKCSNPDCGEEYEMDKAEYFGQVDEAVRANPGVDPPLPIVCKKCGKESLYQAVKCAKCRKIFFYGGKPGDYPDRCECGYSQIEENRRKAAEARRGGE